MSFQGKVVIVTGASRGIGKEIALQFARLGASVACVATTKEGADWAASEIQRACSEGPKGRDPLAKGEALETAGDSPSSPEGAGFQAAIKGYACDVSKPDQVEALIECVNVDLGTPAVLVNNAGITRDTLILRMKDEDWDKVIEVNLKGAFNTIRAVSKLMMRARYGRIVNLSSVIGLHGGAGQANYAAAKAGILGLTMAVAKEFGSRNITCNAVAPGFIETDMTSDLPEEFKEFVHKHAPAGRLGTPADVAPAVLFLSSEEAGYITGQCLTVDGGLML